MKFDRYTSFARTLPAILTSAPILLFLNYHIPDLPVLAQFGTAVLTSLKISPAILFIYPLTQSSRFVGKMIEEHLFGNELFMPTTDLILNNDTALSDEAKRTITMMLLNSGYPLSSATEEMTDEITARKKIVEAMSFIRRKVGNGTYTLQYNIEYGFWRNLVGGSLIALAFCLLELVGIVVYRDFLPLHVVLFLIAIYSLILFFSNLLIRRSAYRYARVLLGEFRLMP